jgi:hypothetical protein
LEGKDQILAAGATQLALRQMDLEHLDRVESGRDPLELAASVLVLLERAVPREAHPDYPLLQKVEIRHPQARRLARPEPGSISQVEHEPHHRVELLNKDGHQRVVFKPRHVPRPLGLRAFALRDHLHGVDGRQATFDRPGEEPTQEIEQVALRLAGQADLSELVEPAHDEGERDLLDEEVPKTGSEVAIDPRSIVPSVPIG